MFDLKMCIIVLTKSNYIECMTYGTRPRVIKIVTDNIISHQSHSYVLQRNKVWFIATITV